MEKIAVMQLMSIKTVGDFLRGPLKTQPDFSEVPILMSGMYCRFMEENCGKEA
ncbi:hypothetical protein LJC14_03030 [Treponema sp. OttesenSCG-928-L16]|nr:hypothetical protein [Treponema sp. OttesenSCG-928-L16]